MERNDGRSPDQMRPVRFTPDFIPTAEGSVLIEVGQTRVVVTASVEDSVPGFLRGSGRGWVTSEYSMLPRATEQRTPRDSSRGRPSGRTLEIQRLIGRSLRAVTDTEALGERTIWVDCDVLQADGGTRTASITGGFAALALACERLVAAGILPSVPLVGSVAAPSGGVAAYSPPLALFHQRDSPAPVDINVVITCSRRLGEIPATAQGPSLPRVQLHQRPRLAGRGIDRLTKQQQTLLQMEFRARGR